MTPRKPNWARDWIICGSPSVGPWVACRAMNMVPTKIPAVPATIVQARDSPSDGPMKPIGMVKYWKLPRNHSGAWCHNLPCRSVSGIQSIERVSIPWMPGPCVRAGALSLVATASSLLARRMRPALNNATVGDAAPRVNRNGDPGRHDYLGAKRGTKDKHMVCGGHYCRRGASSGTPGRGGLAGSATGRPLRIMHDFTNAAGRRGALRGTEGKREAGRGPIDARRTPRFAGPPTFALLPRRDEVERCDVAVVGVPFDSGTSYRPGARFGPSAVRQGSRLLRPWHPGLRVAPFGAQQVADAGDIACNPFDIKEAVDQIEAAA